MVLAACDPNFEFKDSVVDASDRPVARAEVSLVCYGAKQFGVVTDAHGRFEYHRIGAFGDSCAIEVRAGEMAPLTFSVMKHCAHPSGTPAPRSRCT